MGSAQHWHANVGRVDPADRRSAHRKRRRAACGRAAAAQRTRVRDRYDAVLRQHQGDERQHLRCVPPGQLEDLERGWVRRRDRVHLLPCATATRSVHAAHTGTSATTACWEAQGPKYPTSVSRPGASLLMVPPPPLPDSQVRSRASAETIAVCANSGGTTGTGSRATTSLIFLVLCCMSLPPGRWRPVAHDSRLPTFPPLCARRPARVWPLAANTAPPRRTASQVAGATSSATVTVRTRCTTGLMLLVSPSLLRCCDIQAGLLRASL
eukprot:COSAG02_NODE_603_length_19693_cov_3.883944_17_plen_267_part_00